MEVTSSTPSEVVIKKKVLLSQIGYFLLFLPVNLIVVYPLINPNFVGGLNLGLSILLGIGTNFVMLLLILSLTETIIVFDARKKQITIKQLNVFYNYDKSFSTEGKKKLTIEYPTWQAIQNKPTRRHNPLAMKDTYKVYLFGEKTQECLLRVTPTISQGYKNILKKIMGQKVENPFKELARRAGFEFEIIETDDYFHDYYESSIIRC